MKFSLAVPGIINTNDSISRQLEEEKFTGKLTTRIPDDALPVWKKWEHIKQTNKQTNIQSQWEMKILEEQKDLTNGMEEVTEMQISRSLKNERLFF